MARVDLIDGVPFVVFSTAEGEISYEADPRDPEVARCVAEIKRRSAARRNQIRFAGLPGHFELF